MTIDWDQIWTLREASQPRAMCARPVEMTVEPLELLMGAAADSVTRFETAYGSTAYDLVGCTFVELMLVSQAFCDAMEERRVTGWQTYPVELTGRHGERLTGYQGLAVTGRSGAIERSKSQEIIKPPRNLAGKAKRWRRGLFFAPESWDGSDIFIPEGSAWVLVTDRVKDAITDAGLTNIEFQRVTEIELLASGKHWRS
jgi:hypothetical protein